MTAITTIAFDGDDTLWHNEPLFWASTQRFQELLAPYSDPAALAARLEATEIANLALFGYGIKGFVLSMIETAIEISDGHVPNAVIREFLERGKQMLAHPVHVLEGVAETLAEVRDQGFRLVLITKGDLFDQESKLARSGLAELFHAVEIVSEKDEATYARVLARHGDGPGRAVMVGNSVRSDILPVLAAGGYAVHVPYPSTWSHEHAEHPVGHPRFHAVAAMADLPALLQRLSAV
ncbi:MAG TPA: HAD family hydrolase [Magnetospirillum sp.]|nr:HAD family hydrolase [Magnetospirillum sp.]